MYVCAEYFIQPIFLSFADSDWNIKEAYKIIERMCQCSKPLPTKDGDHCEGRHTVEITAPSPHQGSVTSIPVQHLHTGVGSAVDSTTSIATSRGDTFPMRRHTNDSHFPPLKSDIHDDRNIKVGTMPSSSERFVPIQVEKGAAVRLSNPTVGSSGQQSRFVTPGGISSVRQQPRVIATSGLKQGSQMPGMITGDPHHPQLEGRVNGVLKGSTCEVKVATQPKLTGGNLASDKNDRAENSASGGTATSNHPPHHSRAVQYVLLLCIVKCFRDLYSFQKC